jgi:hypothetical protein
MYKMDKSRQWWNFLWWQAGAAKYIQKHYDLSNIAISGSSAGSLTAALLKTDADFDKAAILAIKLADKANVWTSPLGLTGVWGPMVEEWLYELLPDELTKDQANNIYVAGTPLNLLFDVFRQPLMLSNFTSKSSLINACLATAVTLMYHFL